MTSTSRVRPMPRSLSAASTQLLDHAVEVEADDPMVAASLRAQADRPRSPAQATHIGERFTYRRGQRVLALQLPGEGMHNGRCPSTPGRGLRSEPTVRPDSGRLVTAARRARRRRLCAELPRRSGPRTPIGPTACTGWFAPARGQASSRHHAPGPARHDDDPASRWPIYHPGRRTRGQISPSSSRPMSASGWPTADEAKGRLDGGQVPARVEPVARLGGRLAGFARAAPRDGRGRAFGRRRWRKTCSTCGLPTCLAAEEVTVNAIEMTEHRVLRPQPDRCLLSLTRLRPRRC